LKCLEHGLFNRLTEGRGNSKIGVQHRSASLRIGLAVDHVNHSFGPGVHVDIAHAAPRFHGIKPLAILGWLVTHLRLLSARRYTWRQPRGYSAGAFCTRRHPSRLPHREIDNNLVSPSGMVEPLAFRRSKLWCNVVACDITGWARTRRVTSRSISCG